MTRQQYLLFRLEAAPRSHGEPCSGGGFHQKPRLEGSHVFRLAQILAAVPGIGNIVEPHVVRGLAHAPPLQNVPDAAFCLFRRLAGGPYLQLASQGKHQRQRSGRVVQFSEGVVVCLTRGEPKHVRHRRELHLP